MSDETKRALGLAEYEAKELSEIFNKLVAQVKRKGGNVLYRRVNSAIQEALKYYKKYGT